MNSHEFHRQRRRRYRRALMSLEVVLALAVTMVIGVSAIFIGIVSCRNLYQVIATMVASPYL